MLLYMSFRNKRKMNKIIEALKASGRIAFYDEFYDYEKKFYILYYRTLNYSFVKKIKNQI